MGPLEVLLNEHVNMFVTISAIVDLDKYLIVA